MIEDNFDVAFAARAALKEKQIQQAYRPIIAVHKWFARRPGTLFRNLLLSEFGEKPLREIFYRSNDLSGKVIFDPFMGGGTPLLEANRLGADVIGCDINPMSCWIVRREIEDLDIAHYLATSQGVAKAVDQKIGHLYKTRCCKCGNSADVKYFLWVKQQECVQCEKPFDLRPGYLLSKNIRHPLNVVCCANCDALNECDDLKKLGRCTSCKSQLSLEGNAKRGNAICFHCSTKNKFPNGTKPKHRLFAIEYHCSECKGREKGRMFKTPDTNDRDIEIEATKQLARSRPRFIPDAPILKGDETDRLLKWGYSSFSDLFSDRQLLALEMTARLIAKEKDVPIRNALATNFSDLLRYQNMLCRYDTMALKSLDIFSVHGFPVSLIQCESNFLGVQGDTGNNIGSGGWGNITSKYAKAKSYCYDPFETIEIGKRSSIVLTTDEWIGEHREARTARKVEINCRDSAAVSFASESIDAVFTDPPYYGNVQYAELMDFCYVWLRKLVGTEMEDFTAPSTRSPNELTGNVTEGRDLLHFAEGMSQVFTKAIFALKPGGPLAFTFHHNQLSAYAPIAVAILDAGVPCTAVIPCPAEMSGSIHISGTGSSILDTVFVCRKDAEIPIVVPSDLKDALQADVDNLKLAKYQLTEGDLKCIFYGHLTRMCTNRLLRDWDASLHISARLGKAKESLDALSELGSLLGSLNRIPLKDNTECEPGLFEEVR